MINSTKRNNESNSSYYSIIICAIVIITNLSQLPALVENSKSSSIAIAAWTIFAIICFFNNPTVQISKVKGLIRLGALFAAYYIIGMLFIPKYTSSALVYPIMLSFFVLVIGTMEGQILSIEDVERISTAYIISAAIVCVNVYTSYIHGHSLHGRMYLYGSKNSVSQILITAWLLILLLKFNKEIPKPRRIFYILMFALLTYTMIALKSRGTLICMPIALAWVIGHGKLNKRFRNVLVLGIAVFVIILMTNQNLTDFITNEIIYAGRNTHDLDSVSSNRADEWASFLTDWKENWFFGAGRMKRESLILTSLLEFGVLGGSMILCIAIYPFIWGCKMLPREHPLFLTFTSIALVYLANGIFEQLAPFGPGVKCYYLWFMLGILATQEWREFT